MNHCDRSPSTPQVNSAYITKQGLRHAGKKRKYGLKKQDTSCRKNSLHSDFLSRARDEHENLLARYVVSEKIFRERDPNRGFLVAFPMSGEGNLFYACTFCGLYAAPETLYHRDHALLYIAYVMLIWAAPIPADRWHCSLWP